MGKGARALEKATGERCMCFYWALSHMCKVCVLFFFFFFVPGPDCMCVCFFATVRRMCALKALTLVVFFFFFLGTAPLRSAPQCPDPVTVSPKFFYLNSVQQFTGSGFDSPFPFLCLFRIHYPDPPPPPSSVFSPGFTSRSSSKFLGSALFQSLI